jgi:hypothetical protein
LKIRFIYGDRQRFRARHHDVTIRGEIENLNPPVKTNARLNGSAGRPFYVEELPDDATDWVNSYKKTPADLRCKELGEFCIEIPSEDPMILVGENRLLLEIEDAEGNHSSAELRFDWDPTPVPLPLDLRDLRQFEDIQEIGQILNGAFDLDAKQNLIRSRAPVAPDAFLILGSPHGSQEATYAVRFLDPSGAKWLGLSDFMAGQEEGVPPRGIKVGWSSAGMAALSPAHGARAFISWGDHSARPEEWAVVTQPAVPFRPIKRKWYRVRHQIRFASGINQVRFRIWPADETEPHTWLCLEQDDAVPDHLPRHRRASFGLFQHLGLPVEWSDILVKPLGPSAELAPQKGAGRIPFLGRNRPGAF